MAMGDSVRFTPVETHFPLRNGRLSATERYYAPARTQDRRPQTCTCNIAHRKNPGVPCVCVHHTFTQQVGTSERTHQKSNGIRSQPKPNNARAHPTCGRRYSHTFPCAHARLVTMATSKPEPIERRRGIPNRIELDPIGSPRPGSS